MPSPQGTRLPVFPAPRFPPLCCGYHHELALYPHWVVFLTGGHTYAVAVLARGWHCSLCAHTHLTAASENIGRRVFRADSCPGDRTHSLTLARQMLLPLHSFLALPPTPYLNYFPWGQCQHLKPVPRSCKVNPHPWPNMLPLKEARRKKGKYTPLWPKVGHLWSLVIVSVVPVVTAAFPKIII